MNEYLSLTTRVKILLGKRELLLSINSCQGRRVACSNRGINQLINMSINNRSINPSINQSIHCWVEGNCCYLLVITRVVELPTVKGTINQSINQSINTLLGRRELLLSTCYYQGTRVAYIRGVGQSINQSIHCWVEGNCCYLLVITRVVELPTVKGAINQSIDQSINQYIVG